MVLTLEHNQEAGSNLEETIADLPVLGQQPDQKQGGAKQVLDLSPAAYTTFYTWRANGVFHAVRFNDARVKANSRVLMNISEFSTDAQHRFIGAARMAVYNIAPFDGGFFAWVEISWGSPLNIRFDVFVDP